MGLWSSIHQSWALFPSVFSYVQIAGFLMVVGVASSHGRNVSEHGVAGLQLFSLTGEAWDYKETPISTSFLLELFQLPWNSTTLGKKTCSSYVIFPAENTWRFGARGVLYASGLIYCFIGLGTITAVYMEAMEKIVKQTKQIVRKDTSTGATELTQEKIWNSTVADITLLALGTSFPQISLAIIDSIQHLGELSLEGVGPGTLIGSAAFNLFPILAVCVLVPKDGVVKRVENMGVFIVELSWSIWAYVWLFLILKVSSPNKITLWEALLTVLQFPLLILHAYAEDRDWSYISGSFRLKVRTWVQALRVHKMEVNNKPSNEDDDAVYSGLGKELDAASGCFHYEKLQPSRNSNTGHSMVELGVVPSGQSQLQKAGEYDDANSSLDIQFDEDHSSLDIQSLPVDEAQGESPMVFPLHQMALKENDLSLGDKWKAQLYRAFIVQGTKDGKEVSPTLSVLLKHAVTMLWKILFAFIIPADICHGWPTFVCALLCITAISRVVIELADLLGCVSGIRDYFIAITVLAVGTSWPDLIASKIAVEHGTAADSGIANINTSNCVNVFIGMGIPWLIEVSYNRLKLKQGLAMQTSGLSFSVIVYFITFSCCWAVVFLRRYWFGGELGGPLRWARASSAYFMLLWFIFLILSCLRSFRE